MATKKKASKGRVCYVQTSKGIFPFEKLQKAETKSSSKQLESYQNWMTQNDLIPPPYDPMRLLTLYESNSIFMRCAQQLAIDVAGLGSSFKLQEDKKDDKTELNRLKEFLNHKNSDGDKLRSIFKKLLIDWGTIGYYGLEIARNNKQDIAEVFHVPAHTIRVHKSREKYCQVRNNKKVWFKKFGEEGNISAKTGKEFAGRGNSKDRANEMVFYKNYYPKSDYYGVPNIISATGDILGLIGLRDYNLAFFENYGVPAALIVLEGDWDDDSDKKVMDFLNNEIRGAANAHKNLVVTQPANCKFQYQKMGVEVKESSFKLYEKTRREDILIAYSMPAQRIGITPSVGKLGGNVAAEQTTIYVQGVVEPLQLDLEEIINELFQSETYEFKFKDIDTRDLIALSERLTKEVGTAIKTPNQAINEIGGKPYPEGDKYYIGTSLIEVGEADDENKLSKEDEVVIDD
jgi:PBSX family phage portal protein